VTVELPQFDFSSKPLVIGGAAMEYWKLRNAGADIDLVVTHADHARLRHRYPDNVLDIYGDIGVCTEKFEIWNTICRFDYGYLAYGAVNEGNFLVASLEKLLFMKSLVRNDTKSERDVRLIVDEVLRRAYQE
jgi:hypothetical protein